MTTPADQTPGSKGGGTMCEGGPVGQLVRDERRQETILPSGERVTDFDLHVVVDHEVKRRQAILRSLPPRPVEIDPLLPARIVDAWKESYRLTLAAFREQKMRAATELQMIRRGEFTLKGG